jgi:hypothetical protein
LVAQCSILGDEICTILENGGNNGENPWQLERHLADHSLSPNDQKKSAIPPSYSIMTRHTTCWRMKCGRLDGAGLLMEALKSGERPSALALRRGIGGD